MLEKVLSDRAAVEHLKEGLFGPHLDSFVATLCQLGYARSTVRPRLRFLDDLQRWLGRKDLSLVSLHEPVVLRFLEERRSQGRLWKGDAPTAHHFLRHLREKGAIPAPAPAVDLSPLAALRQRYEDYLTKERG